MKYNLVKIKDFPFTDFNKIKPQKRKAGNPASRRGIRYLDTIAAFDIETTNIKEIKQSFMYVWQFGVIINGKIYCVMGRTWTEFKNFILQLTEKLESKNLYLCIYVHNLSFEFSFLKGIYDFSPDEVFVMNTRKVLTCKMFDCLEFRCSYIHSNMSLSLYAEKMGAEHSKLSGEKFDYRKFRTANTPLTEYEVNYCLFDVVALIESVVIDLKSENDNLYTFPLTSTGYVRRDIKKALRAEKFEKYNKALPDYDIYLKLRQAFRGGNTHANRFYTGLILENVYSYDRSSSYPETQINFLYPVGAWKIVTPPATAYIKSYVKKGFACLFDVTFVNLKLKDYHEPVPYLTKDKARNALKIVNDNGRVISADCATFTLTDIDYFIIEKIYDWDCAEITFFAISRYGELPQSMKSVILDYYQKKTALKGVDGLEILYHKFKNKFNAIFGLTAMKTIQDDWKYIFKGFERVESSEEEDRVKLEKYNRVNLLSYAWGVWTTAHARRELQEGIDIAGTDFVYGDTDSVKSLRPLDFTNYNNEKIRLAEKNGGKAFDSKKNLHYLGVYEFEGKIDKFRTWGAKKYCSVYGEKIILTVAGVSKKYGGIELKEKGGIEAFEPGFIFRKAGGTESRYNDGVNFIYKYNGEDVHITDNVYIEDSEYTLGITNDYVQLIRGYNINEKNF